MEAGLRKVNLDRALAAAKGKRMTRVKPADCTDMAEVRNGVDRLDEEIVALLAERFRYMAAAARIKPERSQVRDEARKAAVIANARRVALAAGAPVERLVALYEALVESSIAYELERFDERRPA
jgi:isochorismate pyruvate lyase